VREAAEEPPEELAEESKLECAEFKEARDVTPPEEDAEESKGVTDVVAVGAAVVVGANAITAQAILFVLWSVMITSWPIMPRASKPVLTVIVP